MNDLTPDFLARSREAFASNRGTTLQDVRNRVAETAKGTLRRDLLSALDSVFRLYGSDLATIPATPKSLRSMLASKTAAELGLSEKRFANIRSLLSRVIRDYAGAPEPITKRIPLTDDWKSLLVGIENRFYRTALHRLAAYCSLMAILPSAMDREVLLGFYEALNAEEIVKDTRRLLKHTIAHWNMCRKRVAGWPDITLSSPFKKEPISLPLSAFPAAFHADLEGWRQRLLDPDVLDPEAPSRKLRRVTVDGYVDRILRFASVLVREGHLMLEQITSLASIVEIGRYKAGLRFFLARAGKTPTPYIAQMANQLRHVAKYHCKLDSAVLKEMEVICRNLEVGHVRQMTDKNRARLRQFDNPEKVAKLLAFPAQERARGLAQKNPHRAAKCFERALVVDLFIHCTLRIGTLHQINMTTDLNWAGGKCYLSIDGSIVKTDRPLEFELPSETATLLAEYIREHRPKLAGSKGPYLFPGRDGGPRSHSTIRHDFTEVMRRRAGLVMNPHLMRHAIGKIVVERNPELYAVMSRQLGHKRMDMTMQHYLGTETRVSGRHIDKLLRRALADPKIKDE